MSGASERGGGDPRPGALDAVIARLMGCRDLALLLQHVADVVATHTAADGAYVFMIREAGDLMKVVAGVGDRREQLLGVSRRRGETMSGMAWQCAEPVFVADAAADPLVRLDWSPGTQLFAVPLLVGEHVHGVLLVASSAHSPDLAPELGLIERLAGLASIAVDNARSLEASAAELRRTRALGALSALLTDFTGRDEEFDEVCRVLLNAFDAARVDAWLIGPDGLVGAPVAAAIGERLDETTDVQIEPPPPELVGETIIQWCCTHATAAFLPRDADDPRESARVHAARRERQVGSNACAPLVVERRVIGLVALVRERSRRDFDENELHVFHSITHQIAAAVRRHELTLALEHQAHHDSLTGLPNRRRFELTLHECVKKASAARTRVAVLFLDLDGFKRVNDTLGHTVGDELLRRVARRLVTHTREGDLLARMGGDEFALIVHEDDAPRGDGEDPVLPIAHRLVSALDDHFDVNGSRLRVGTSIGVSRFPDDGEGVDELLRNADVAMYRAKALGKGCVVAFDRAHAEEARRRATLELELGAALERGEFRLFYQPQVRCADGRVSALEALIRWQHPTRGLLAPGAFVPIAEQAGLIGAIGAWVIEEAVRQWSAWRAEGTAVPRVAVNVAASQFRAPRFTDAVLECLARHGASPAALELEVTESLFMQDVEQVAARLGELRAAGVRIAVDDFGTGYSSLCYLRDLPLDVLKIDRSFVVRLEEGACPESSLVGTIHSLAADLGLESVAEGVENAAQLAAVTALGCDVVQGYHFSRPVPAGEVAASIAAIHAAAGTACPARAA